MMVSLCEGKVFCEGRYNVIFISYAMYVICFGARTFVLNTFFPTEFYIIKSEKGAVTKCEIIFITAPLFDFNHYGEIHAMEFNDLTKNPKFRIGYD